MRALIHSKRRKQYLVEFRLWSTANILGLHTCFNLIGQQAMSIETCPTRVLLVSDRLPLGGDCVLEDVHSVLDRLPVQTHL